jgi:hypothetical protein
VTPLSHQNRSYDDPDSAREAVDGDTSSANASRILASRRGSAIPQHDVAFTRPVTAPTRSRTVNTLTMTPMASTTALSLLRSWREPEVMLASAVPAFSIGLSRKRCEEVEKLAAVVTASCCEVQEISAGLEDLAFGGGRGDGDAASSPELDDSFVAEVA